MTRHFFVGVDIESIVRFRKLVESDDKDFLKKVFSPHELKYSFSKKNPSQHLAARFAGKEAVMKALMSSGCECPPHSHIEILNDPKGAPYVRIKGDLFKNYSIKISLSHCDEKALAFVVMFVDSQSDQNEV